MGGERQDKQRKTRAKDNERQDQRKLETRTKEIRLVHQCQYEAEAAPSVEAPSCEPHTGLLQLTMHGLQGNQEEEEGKKAGWKVKLWWISSVTIVKSPPPKKNKRRDGGTPPSAAVRRGLQRRATGGRRLHPGEAVSPTWRAARSKQDGKALNTGLATSDESEARRLA